MITDPFLARFQTHLDTLLPGWPGGRFLVAYSGGLDSTALLHLMARSLPANLLAAAHLNHSLRGPAAAADQSFAQKTAASLGLTFLTGQADVPALARQRRKGVEEAARWARYDFLGRTAASFQADFILTAHQADDQAESVLLNLVKGAGPAALAGIAPRRPLLARPGEGAEVVRPLLPFDRAELAAWLIGQNLTWVEDLTNQDQRYRRNALRRQGLPALRRLNPRLNQALGRLAALARAEEVYWQGQVEKLRAGLVREEGPAALALERPALERLTVAEQRRLIHACLLKIWLTRRSAPEPMTFATLEMTLSLLGRRRHPGLDLPGGLRAAVTPQVLRLSLASRLS
jgi:tRNA(Ile)-lysidine synthase